MSKIYKIVATGYTLQREGENHPDEWDWGYILRNPFGFMEPPEIEITEMVESTNETTEIA